MHGRTAFIHEACYSNRQKDFYQQGIIPSVTHSWHLNDPANPSILTNTVNRCPNLPWTAKPLPWLCHMLLLRRSDDLTVTKCVSVHQRENIEYYCKFRVKIATKVKIKKPSFCIIQLLFSALKSSYIFINYFRIQNVELLTNNRMKCRKNIQI